MVVCLFCWFLWVSSVLWGVVMLTVLRSVIVEVVGCEVVCFYVVLNLLCCLFVVVWVWFAWCDCVVCCCCIGCYLVLAESYSGF